MEQLGFSPAMTSRGMEIGRTTIEPHQDPRNWMKLGGPSSDRSDEQQSEIPLIQASKLMKPQINPHIIYVDLNSIE